jgi:predicted PurR-regulated permease PerM
MKPIQRIIGIHPKDDRARAIRIEPSLGTIVMLVLLIRGQLITSALMAVFVFALLKACGVSNALAIAVFAGATDVLPYIGALLSVGVSVAASLSHSPPSLSSCSR